ncbi:SLATT domain-containing protein [Mesorhizobium sp. M0217]
MLRNNNWSLFLLAYYSVFTVVLAVFPKYFEAYFVYFDGISVAASVAVLVASLVVGGFRFERTASLFRDCYLALQKLTDSDVDTNAKRQRYSDILQMCPNHSNGDYYDFMVSHTYLNGKRVWSAGEEVKFTPNMVRSYYFRQMVFCVLMLCLVAVPLAFVLAPLIAPMAKVA